MVLFKGLILTMSNNADQQEEIREQYLQDAENLTHIANKLQAEVVGNLERKGITGECYLYKSRVKSTEDLLEKICRKRDEGKKDYNLASITDVVGFRFVTLYRREIGDILETILNAIKPALTSNGEKMKVLAEADPFSVNHIIETIIYPGNNPGHELNRWQTSFETILGEKAKNGIAENKIEHTDPAYKYTSIHIVIMSAENIPIEIQIRSVFEDAWAELNHKIRYRKDSGKSTAYEINNPDLITHMLDNMKGFVDNCADYADLIYRESHGEEHPKTQSVIHDPKNREELLQLLRQIGLTEEQLQLLKVAMNDDNDLLERAEQYRNALNVPSLDEKQNHIYYFYCVMNEAFCYLTFDSVESRKKALKLYEDILIKYADFPMVTYRYAQVLEKVGQLKEVRHWLEKALSAIVLFDNTPEENWGGNMLVKDYFHIKGWGNIKLSFYKWHEADEKDRKKESAEVNLISSQLYLASNEAYKNVESALEVTNNEKVSLEERGELKRATNNNGLYYSSIILQYLEQSPNQKEQGHWQEKLKQHVDYMISHVKINDNDLDQKDSLARGYYFLAEYEKAKELFEDIIDKLADPVLKELYTDQELMILLREAREFLLKIKKKFNKE